VHEALVAADRPAADGIPARVIDLYSIKPVDTTTLRSAAALIGRFVTAEDHWPQGGLADAVTEALTDGRPAPADHQACGHLDARLGDPRGATAHGRNRRPRHRVRGTRPPRPDR